MEINYNFENPNKEQEDELRIQNANHRITRCCGNCTFFIKKNILNYKGYCGYPVRQAAYNKHKGVKFENRTYVFMLCDLYQHKKIRRHTIQRWLNKQIKNDGLVEYND